MNLYLFLYFFPQTVIKSDIISFVGVGVDFYRSEIVGHYVSVETKNHDLTRFLNFRISMYCNKNHLNDYIFDYIFCEINLEIRIYEKKEELHTRISSFSIFSFLKLIEIA